MARYEHLPIYKTAFDFNLYVEQIVRNFSRYHKYTLGTELRHIKKSGKKVDTSRISKKIVKEVNHYVHK